MYNGSFSYCGSIGSGGRSDLSNSDSWHPGGVNVTMADGSVRFIKNSINIQTWMALGTTRQRRSHQLRQLLIDCQHEGGMRTRAVAR